MLFSFANSSCYENTMAFSTLSSSFLFNSVKCPWNVLKMPIVVSDCTSLSSLFMDLKNLVNGKVTNTLRNNEEYPKCALEHRLVTIPQKEDGKKKYPQRSCRLCWRIGRRRDTRFMCSACELPFCKSPCFEIHYNDMFKVSQLQGDYYAT